jgi:hypothetical protein
MAHQPLRSAFHVRVITQDYRGSASLTACLVVSVRNICNSVGSKSDFDDTTLRCFCLGDKNMTSPQRSAENCQLVIVNSGRTKHIFATEHAPLPEMLVSLRSPLINNQPYLRQEMGNYACPFVNFPSTARPRPLSELTGDALVHDGGPGRSPDANDAEDLWQWWPGAESNCRPSR